MAGQSKTTEIQAALESENEALIECGPFAAWSLIAFMLCLFATAVGAVGWVVVRLVMA